MNVCAFCGKSLREVVAMCQAHAPPAPQDGVCICNECVQQCVQIMTASAIEWAAKPKPKLPAEPTPPMVMPPRGG